MPEVRAFYRAVAVSGANAPYDRLTLKVYYPAQSPDSDEARNSGVVPADDSKAPFPVIIFMPGINVGPEAYHWLALELVTRGFVFVAYSWVAEEMPGYISLTPGVDIESLKPDTFGSRPTSPALQPISDELADLNSKGLLAALLDLDHIILGGHSAGGTMALQNANPAWFPGVQAAFTYGAHTAAATMLGYEPDTILPLAPDVRYLIMGGTHDGVIEASGHRYSSNGAGPTRMVERTFHEAAQTSAQLVLFEGANHFTLAYPMDTSTGRPFLDKAATQGEDQLRALIARTIIEFIQKQPLAMTSEHELVAKAASK